MSSTLPRPAPLEETEAVFFGPAGLDRAAAERISTRRSGARTTAS